MRKKVSPSFHPWVWYPNVSHIEYICCLSLLHKYWSNVEHQNILKNIINKHMQCMFLICCLIHWVCFWHVPLGMLPIKSNAAIYTEVSIRKELFTNCRRKKRNSLNKLLRFDWKTTIYQALLILLLANTLHCIYKISNNILIFFIFFHSWIFLITFTKQLNTFQKFPIPPFSQTWPLFLTSLQLYEHFDIPSK